MATFNLSVNGKARNVDVQQGTPLLWVLRDSLGLTVPKFGCGEGYCGCCTVMIDGEAAKSCGIDVESAVGKKIVTIEGLSSGKVIRFNAHGLRKMFLSAVIASPAKS